MRSEPPLDGYDHRHNHTARTVFEDKLFEYGSYGRMVRKTSGEVGSAKDERLTAPAGGNWLVVPIGRSLRTDPA
jgi:hypothetical protein